VLDKLTRSVSCSTSDPTPPVSAALRIATRSSPLALWQSNFVADLLAQAHPELPRPELVAVDTLGDRTQALGTPLHEIGGQGVFVKEVQAAVLDGRADIAVHSAKDLPSAQTPGLVIACVPHRDDPRDGLVGSTLADLPDGATVASGSVRRRAQLLAVRPDLRFVEIRGNMAKRVAKASEPGIDAVVVGCAGLDRIGLGHHIAERLDPEMFTPQVAQAAIAVECGIDDLTTVAALAAIDDSTAHMNVIIERAYLFRLGSGCDLPVAAWCREEEGGLRLDAMIAALDGSHTLEVSEWEEPISTHTVGRAWGYRIAEEILADGGEELLRGADRGPSTPPQP
jgi:hydroxymethylbilane synthase